MKQNKTLLIVLIVISVYVLLLLCIGSLTSDSNLSLIVQAINLPESLGNSDIKSLTRRYKNSLRASMDSSKKYASTSYEIFGKVQGMSSKFRLIGIIPL